jgi:hypothetical protein
MRSGRPFSQPAADLVRTVRQNRVRDLRKRGLIAK